jgi:hypothetical protein
MSRINVVINGDSFYKVITNFPELPYRISPKSNSYSTIFIFGIETSALNGILSKDELPLTLIIIGVSTWVF